MKNITLISIGVLLSIVTLYTWNYYEKNIRDKEIYHNNARGLVESNLREEAIKIEVYRIVFGYYPKSMKSLRDGFDFLDPLTTECKCSRDFYYQTGENKDSYFLFSVGSDCKAFTEDDVHPQFSDGEMERIGYRVPSISEHMNDKFICK